MGRGGAGERGGAAVDPGQGGPVPAVLRLQGEGVAQQVVGGHDEAVLLPPVRLAAGQRLQSDRAVRDAS